MDLSHDSTSILGQLRKGQAEINVRLDAIRVELQRLNVHLEQLSAVLSTPHPEPPPVYPAHLHLTQVVLGLRPRALAMWAHVQSFPQVLRSGKPPVSSLGNRVLSGPAGPGPANHP